MRRFAPKYVSGNLQGQAGQSGSSGACNGVTVNTKLRRDLQFSPDPTLATGGGTGNTTVTMTAGCINGNVYYTSSSSSSSSYTESGRTSPC